MADRIDLTIGEVTTAALIGVPAGAGPFPGVVAAFHRGGLDGFTERLIDELAANGYAAIAPNHYHALPEGVDVEQRRDYLTDEQFGFVAGVTGTMVREKPAACFYFGAFYAESLVLAEMGNSIGAIQVAGTAMPSQLPFFVAACDYTLIGEEFFAASAYLSGEPHQLGSLKGQDVGKAIGTLLLLAGCILATILQFTQKNESVGAAFSFLKDNILGSKGFLP